MPSHETSKLHGLDHLRAFAISYVFLFHYFILSKGEPPWLPDFARFGWTGVDLFFVLSGFLISSQLFLQIKKGELISFKLFFLKRFFRIVPAFLFTLLLYFSFPLFREKESLAPLWKYLSFTQNFGLDLKNNGTFSHAWSLCVEEHFYFVLPLLLLFLQKSHRISKSYWILMVLFVMGFIIRYASYQNLYTPHIEKADSWMYWYKYIYYPSYNRLDGLIIGVAIAALYQFLPKYWNRLASFGNLFILMGILLLIAAYYVCVNQQSFLASTVGFPLVSLGYGLIVMGAVSSSSVLYQWKSNVTSFLAGISYALYLVHKGIIHLTHIYLAEYSINNNYLLVLSVITCVLAAYLIHISIEKPFMRLRLILQTKK